MDLSSLVNFNSAWLPILLLFVSLIGSTHCLVMCVPILGAQKKGNFTDYHLGRLSSYIILATLLYFLDKQIVNNQVLWLITGLMFLVYFVWINVKENLSNGCCSKNKSTSILEFKNVYLLGLLNGLLPCGWLFIILLLLSKTQSYILFLIYVGIFWLGTVPVFHILKLKGSMKKYFPILRNKILVRSLYFIFALYSFCLHFQFMPVHTMQSDPVVFCGIRLFG